MAFAVVAAFSVEGFSVELAFVFEPDFTVELGVVEFDSALFAGADFPESSLES